MDVYLQKGSEFQHNLSLLLKHQLPPVHYQLFHSLCVVVVLLVHGGGFFCLKRVIILTPPPDTDNVRNIHRRFQEYIRYDLIQYITSLHLFLISVKKYKTRLLSDLEASIIYKLKGQSINMQAGRS